MKNSRNPLILTASVLLYYVMAFAGFSLLKFYGIYYNGDNIHIYAIPMMAVISIYVFWINRKPLFHKEDFRYKKEYLGLDFLPYLSGLMVLASIIESVVTKKFSTDLIFMAVLTFLIGVSEEGMFRLYMLERCGSSLKDKVGWLLFSSVTFAVLHMMNMGGGLSFDEALSQTFLAFPFGLTAGFLFLVTGNIGGLIFWHMMYDYVLFSSQVAQFFSVIVLSFVMDVLIVLALIRGVLSVISDFRNRKKQKTVNKGHQKEQEMERR